MFVKQLMKKNQKIVFVQFVMSNQLLKKEMEGISNG